MIVSDIRWSSHFHEENIDYGKCLRMEFQYVIIEHVKSPVPTLCRM